MKQEYATALEHLKQECNESATLTMPILAATYVELGMMAEARATVARMRAENPEVSVALVGQVSSHRDPAVQARFLDALRRAGLPEN
ncbi:MAG TPA: hypothetical protein VFR34_00055 [Paracoccaceae bacterium]|nr:hypothetical protein [Paracoccaceae bacterium]